MFFLLAVLLSIAISVGLLVIFPLLLALIGQQEVGRAKDYLFLPVGGAFAVTLVLVLTYLVWDLARRWVIPSRTPSPI